MNKSPCCCTLTHTAHLAHSHNRERHSEEAVPESKETAAAIKASSVMQPGGAVFVKPSTFYPNDGAYSNKKGEGINDGPKPVAGVPVSGRPWKLECKRHSSIITKNSIAKKTWDQKMAEKKKQQTIKAKENALKQERIVEKREKKRLQQERKLQKEANILKGAVVQVIQIRK